VAAILAKSRQPARHRGHPAVAEAPTTSPATWRSRTGFIHHQAAVDAGVSSGAGVAGFLVEIEVTAAVPAR
jgi:hypothetical protein